MRKFLVAGVIAALGIAVLAVPASASFDHHFSVIEKQTSARQLSANTFRFEAKMLDPRNRHDRVGRDWSKCKFTAHKVKCRATVHLNGEIGGFGNIAVNGDFERHDNRLNVTGGTHDFNGVAGKMLFHNLHGGPPTSRFHFDLTR